MKAYKLTDQNNKTFNGTQWGENVAHEALPGNGPLCTNKWIHFYKHPLIAVLANPCHANFTKPVMWEAEAEGEKLHEALKSGCKKLTTIRKIPLPHVTLIQRIAFGILCVKKFYYDEKWTIWADNWLNDTDRSTTAAYVASFGAFSFASYAAAYAASHYIPYAAVAYAAYASNTDIDFIEVAKEAMKY